MSTIVPINRDSCHQIPCLAVIVNDPTLAENYETSWENWNISWGFKSRHPGGAQFLFGDGSVHFLQQTISDELYNKLGCRDDGEVEQFSEILQ